MSKFKEEELVKYFDDMCLFLAIHHWTKRDERAVAIREMIEKKPEEEEIEVRYIEIILDLYDRLEKKKPEVDEEFVEKHARKIVEGIFHREYTMGNSQTLKALKKMLKKAGMEVVER